MRGDKSAQINLRLEEELLMILDKLVCMHPENTRSNIIRELIRQADQKTK